MTAASCATTALVDRHFSGRLEPTAERALREHLPSCPVCRARYERQLELEAVLGDGPGPQRRLARGLGLSGKPARLAWAQALAFATAAALALFWVVHPVGETRGPTARGPQLPPASRLLVYRVAPGQPPALAPREMSPNDELAFAYEHQGPERWLMIFGVDEHRHVYWYHPSWTEPDANPVALPVAPGQGLRELPEAIRQPLDGERLTLHAVFADRPLTVRDVEQRVREVGDVAAPLGLPRTTEDVVELRVRAAQ